MNGKVTSSGSYDPPFVLYDPQARAGVKNRVLSEVSTNKQTGAALYWNGDTHKLEVYIASEDRFYGLDGSLLADTNTVKAGPLTPHFRPQPAVRTSAPPRAH